MAECGMKLSGTGLEGHHSMLQFSAYVNRTLTDCRRFQTAGSRAAVAVSCSRLSGCEGMWPEMCVTAWFLRDPCSTLLGIVFIQCILSVET